VLPEIGFNEPYSYFPDSLSRQFVNRAATVASLFGVVLAKLSRGAK
jgi:hypothetical protein